MLNSRSKGQRGEREVAAMLQQVLVRVLGEDAPVVKRNLDQWRSGGYDLVGVEGFAIEVKYQEKMHLNKWWGQAVAQATGTLMPVLFYRKNHQPWRVRMLVDLNERLRVPADLDCQAFLDYFEDRLRCHYNNGFSSEASHE
jgi:hypothetical protein